MKFKIFLFLIPLLVFGHPALNAVESLNYSSDSIMVDTLVQDVPELVKDLKVGTVPESDAYSLRVFRPQMNMGWMLNYDLYLGDKLLTRVYNGLDTTFVLKNDGINTIWARTEHKVEMFVNFKLGHEYEIQCGVANGTFIGNPYFTLLMTK